MIRHERPIAALLSLILLQPAVCSDGCVNVLPSNVSHLMLQQTTLTLENFQLRLFPNITFNCDGSIVGWSVIAPQHTRVGGLPQLSVWTKTSESDTFLKTSFALLTPCIRTVINAEDNTYLHENVLDEPMEFHRGNILGILLRRKNIARFQPYFMSKDSFVSTFRETLGSPPNDTESISGESDNKLPLLSLVICARGDEREYKRCVAENSKPKTCAVDMPSPSSGSSKSGSLSQGQLTAVIVIPLSLAILTLVVVVVSVLAYVWVRRRRSRGGKSIVTVTNEPQPYAEPIIVKSTMSSSPLPTPRSQTPLPPIPSLCPQPLYSVLDGPSPSPPPPYSIEQQKPAGNTLQSPEYESIDGFSKTGLPRQNAIDSGFDCGKSGMADGREGSGGIESGKYESEEK